MRTSPSPHRRPLRSSLLLSTRLIMPLSPRTRQSPWLVAESGLLPPQSRRGSLPVLRDRSTGALPSKATYLEVGISCKSPTFLFLAIERAHLTSRCSC
ncbi:uncharacterized protein CC84DRAFT_39363 [Paraphaeosphaeria sporulosa]|uniref:Uncharacterized protein n=1 Tax=Paraphaeosphaeria sporulosa TaxID=1460663 RepID=A0A177CXS6_9PLEO|nr:uncharacterized protein CC84DRAFT_39363 [Paraphaeosphaeria sporulosa]OAG11519.1 hypothetical protein CC84DRAFT_39363 [Paraphaeosphaeria sporulosa]